MTDNPDPNEGDDIRYPEYEGDGWDEFSLALGRARCSTEVLREVADELEELTNADRAKVNVHNDKTAVHLTYYHE